MLSGRDPGHKIIVPEASAQYGFDDCDDDWLYFIHGAATSGPADFDTIEDIGQGEFGRGFYTFRLCVEDGEQGRQRAIQRAEIKAQRGGTACLVYLKIERRVYDGLRQTLFNLEEATAAYNRYARMKETGFDLVCGPVLRNKGREAIPDFPLQYKFEGNGTRALIIHEIITLTHEEMD